MDDQAVYSVRNKCYRHKARDAEVTGILETQSNRGTPNDDRIAHCIDERPLTVGRAEPSSE